MKIKDKLIHLLGGFTIPYNDEILYWGDIDPKRIKVYEPNAIQHIEMFNRMRVEWK